MDKERKKQRSFPMRPRGGTRILFFKVHFYNIKKLTESDLK